MLARTPHTRRGQVSLLTVFAVFTLMLIIAGVLNVSRTTATKMEQQNAADAAAHAAGLELARGMNTLVVLNHLMAELNALDALVMSFGGIELEEKTPVPLPNGPALAALPRAVEWNGGVPPVAKRAAATGVSRSGGAIGDARKKLLPILADAYRVHAAGGVMCTDPLLRGTFEAPGRLLVAAAAAVEATIEFEWLVLDQLEVMAETQLLPLKHLCNPGIPKDDKHTVGRDWGFIPRLYKYSLETVERTPERAADAAKAMAERHGATGSVFPTLDGEPFKFELPVEKEPHGPKSQMVRGMTPWVQYWRRPILVYGTKVLRLSEFAPAYHKHSNEFTLNMARWQWEENKTRLFRLKDSTPNTKGREKWTTAEGSDRADELFCTLGFALKPPPEVIGMPIFRQPQPDGIAAVAQVMIYNANPQHLPRQKKMQPMVGWDTLGWVERLPKAGGEPHPVPEYEYGKDFEEEMRRPRTKQPLMALNWHAKLVPVTPQRLTDAVGTQEAELNRILDRLVTDRPLVNTR